MNFSTDVGPALFSCSFVTLGNEKTFVLDILLFDCVDEQPTIKERLMKRTAPEIVRI